MAKKHFTLLGEALDKSNGWTKSDRLLALAFSPIFDPGMLLAKGLEKIGIDMTTDYHDPTDYMTV